MRFSIKVILILSFSFIAFSRVGLARVSALFHPYDPTLEKIAELILEAKDTIDIAMYNMETSSRSPVVEVLQSAEVQQRLKRGELKVRLIFEGFATKAQKQQKMEKLEALGIDVRYLNSNKKMHHKFAVIDAYTGVPTTVTGSANWSLSSYRNYNEAIVFAENELGLSLYFQNEFNRIWDNSHEFGQILFPGSYPSVSLPLMSDYIQAYFNSDNFLFIEGEVIRNPSSPGWELTRKVVDAIDAASDHVQVASTRLKLRPVYEAILRAAQRNVKVDVVVTLGEYVYEGVRANMELPNCSSVYAAKCSSGVNYAAILSKGNYPGYENVEVRVKFFNLNPAARLAKQMHSKYFVVDHHIVWTGSFNWSYSSEYSHIENLVMLNGDKYYEVVSDFSKDFVRLWNQNRDQYVTFLGRVATALESGEKIDCSFETMTLSFDQIDYLLASGKRAGKRLKDACL